MDFRNLWEERYKLIHPLKYCQHFLDQNIHQDGRKLDEFRTPLINVGILSNALGSSAIKLGNSNVVCGIRAELAKPRPDLLGHGYIVPNVDVSLISSTRGINENDLELLTYKLYNLFNDSVVVKLEDLCIDRKKLVWALYLDVICMDVDGGLFDAVVLACVMALKNLKLPLVTYDEKTSKIEVGSEEKKINVNTYPVTTTHGVCDNDLIMDPTFDEELASSSLMHIGIFDNEVGYIQKIGGKPIKFEDMETSITNSMKRELELCEAINKQ